MPDALEGGGKDRGGREREKFQEIRILSSGIYAEEIYFLVGCFFFLTFSLSRDGGILINESCSEKWRDFNLDPFPLLSYTFFSRLSISS